MVYLSRFEQQASQSEPSLSTWESRLNKWFSYSRSLTVLLSGGIWQCQETVWFSQLGKWEVLQSSHRNTPQCWGQAPTAKMAPVLPILDMRSVPAAEIVTDKDRAGEPCAWCGEEAGVQCENMKLQSPLSFLRLGSGKDLSLYNFTVSLELFWIGFQSFAQCC